MAYTLTPSDRRARAQSLMQERENRRFVSQYAERQKEALEESERQQLQAARAEYKEKESQNFLVRGLSTIGDLAANVITGAVKGLEGIYDLGAGIVGGIGGIFDKDF